MKHGWIPIWRDGGGWQLWDHDEYLATVSLCRHGRGLAYIPAESHSPISYPSFLRAATAVIRWNEARR